MKLRKALEKAKGLKAPKQKPSAKKIVAIEHKVCGNDWKPPVYSDSIRVQLDHECLLENRCICISPDAPELESYKVLRTKIQQLTKQKGWNTLMVTSADAGAGKTFTAVNLSLTFARAYNQTVMLVDCDFHHQSIQQMMGFESDAGLIDYLVDGRSLNEFIIWPGIDKMTVISGGRTFDDSSELLGSPRMKKLVQELKTRYDDRYIIFDVPPIIGSADALALTPHVDCIVMVVEEGKTAMRNVLKAVEAIPQEKFLGFVMNKQKIGWSRYRSYYGRKRSVNWSSS
jgi:non-specific protein-tyrosine kinase